MARELLIDDLTKLDSKVSLKDIKHFMSIVEDNELPQVFAVECDEGIFKFNRRRKELYLLERFSCSYKQNRFKYPSDLHIDLIIIRFMKTAKLSGYKTFYEPKFSN